MKSDKNYQLLNNSRFYILVFSLLLSVSMFAFIRLSIDNDQLFLIRLQQMYGFICLLFWYVALIISPLGHVIGKQHMKHIEFARRAIGVSAFYFALLHSGIALFGQLGGFEQVQHLPGLFKWSLVGGAAALLVLGLMAATSFDKVIKYMTFKKWKWLHRLVYAAGILVILHVWMIGTHLAYSGVQMAGFMALAVLVGLELLRTTRIVNRKYLHLNRSEAGILFVSVWVTIMIALVAMPSLVDNYHSRHTGHSSRGDI